MIDRDRTPLRWSAPRLGGPVGRHARLSGFWFDPAPWVFVAAALTWSLLALRQLPCRQLSPSNPINAYYRLCYSDIPITYQSGGLDTGRSPFDTGTAWPGVAMLQWVARALADLLGADVHSGLSAQQSVDASRAFSAVTAVLLFGCFVILIRAHLGLQAGGDPDRAWPVLMLAAAPVVLAAGLISWDLAPVTLLALALLSWARGRPTTAGVLLGAAVSCAAYPLLMLVALLPLCYRTGRWSAFGRTLAAASITWLALNAYPLLRYRAAWKEAILAALPQREPGYGSLWYILAQAEVPVPSLRVIAPMLWLLAMVCLCVIAATAPRRPRLGPLLFALVVAHACLASGYPPQHALWTLPLLLLARPKLVEWAAMSAAEVCYFLAVWGHLAGTLRPGSGGPDTLYWLAIFVRLGVSGWLVVRVVGDMLHPELDPVREPGVDDPIGGPLDHAPDAQQVPLYAADDNLLDEWEDADAR